MALDSKRSVWERDDRQDQGEIQGRHRTCLFSRSVATKHGQHNAAVVAATKVTHCLLNSPTDSRASTALESATYTAPRHAQSIARRTHLRWPPFDVLHDSRSVHGLLFHLLRTHPALSIQRGMGPSNTPVQISHAQLTIRHRLT